MASEGDIVEDMGGQRYRVSEQKQGPAFSVLGLQ